MITIHQALQAATATLAASSPTPRLDAELLLAHVLGVSRVHLLTEAQQPLTSEQQTAFEALINRRATLEPVAYLIGHKEFYGFDFVVDHRVLVPRPETELIVELARDWTTRRESTAPLTIADIGTGSGCLAITLALLLPAAQVFAVDLSPDALAVARINVGRHNVSDRVQLLHGDGCAPLPQPVDLLVTNPPYTRLDEVDENVRRWEPHLALEGGGADGWDLPRRLLRQMPGYLRPNGAIFMEIAAWQRDLALQTAAVIFPTASVKVHTDLAGLPRTLAIETALPRR